MHAARVLWLVKGLGPGGAERLLVEHARGGDRARLSYEAAFLLDEKRQLVPELEALDVPVHWLGVRSAADPRWVARLRALVRRQGFDVVHIHSPALAALARPALRSMRAAPALVTTEHNRWPSYHPLTRAANRATSSLDDATIAVSEDVRSTMGSHAQVTEVLLHGIDTAAVREQCSQRAAVRSELGVDADELLAVTVANLREKKGYPTLLEAVRRVVDRGVRILFVAAGQGPLEAQLRAQVTALGIDDRFRLLGYVPDAARLIAGADVFVLASRHEGLPLAVMEALALGVPVVATDVGGIPDLVEQGRSGLLVPADDPDALADALLAITEKELRSRLAAGAATRGDQVDGRAAIRRLDQLYLELVATRDRR